MLRDLKEESANKADTAAPAPTNTKLLFWVGRSEVFTLHKYNLAYIMTSHRDKRHDNHRNKAT